MSAQQSALGLVQWFQPGQHDLVEACIKELRRRNIRHLRTHVSWADYHTPGGPEWYSWLLAKLSPHVEVLPCVHYTPPFLAENGRTSGPPRDLRAYADFIDHIIKAHGDHFTTIELWNEPNNLLDWDWRLDPDWLKFCTMIGAAAYWARQCGKRVVLGGPCPTDVNWLRLMGERGLLGVVDVVGLHGFPGTWDSVEGGTWPGWESLLGGVRQTVAPFNDKLEFWITETGYSTWRHDPFNQVRAFLDAVEAPADRLYWYGLRDTPADVAVQEGANFDVRHYHLGILQADGSAKLLGRMMEQGLPAVQQLAAARPSVAVVGRKPPILITGGAGFIGCNLADRLARDGENVLIYDSLARPGVEQNLAWLRKRHPRRTAAAIADVRDEAGLSEAVDGASAIFHFAAQVAVTTSMDNPRDDLHINLLGTFNLLEAARRRRQPCIFASTNKVYGKLGGLEVDVFDDAYAPLDPTRRHGIGESQMLDFCTPYGCSKGAADQYVLDYSRNFAVPTAVMRMSCIYGPRQFGTEDQGWVAHFLLRALAEEPINIYGDGRQVRDILFVDDAVEAYVAAWRNIGKVAGQAFNLGGGPANAVSLLQVIRHAEHLLDRPVDVCFADWRPDDQRYYVSDTRRVRQTLALPAPTEWRRGIATLLQHLADARGVRLPRVRAPLAGAMPA
jgi:CDP-paratose 2-epimerase